MFQDFQEEVVTHKTIIILKEDVQTRDYHSACKQEDVARYRLP